MPRLSDVVRARKAGNGRLNDLVYVGPSTPDWAAPENEQGLLPYTKRRTPRLSAEDERVALRSLIPFAKSAGIAGLGLLLGMPEAGLIDASIASMPESWQPLASLLGVAGGKLSRSEVRERALATLRSNPEGLLAEYTRRFGRRLNADDAAELFPDYSESVDSRTTYRAAVHPAAQSIRDELFRRALADSDVKEVVFTAGGNGSGKSTGGLSGDVVMDTTLSNPEHSATLIQEALEAGKRVHIVYTYRPIASALEGVLERSKSAGRTVSIDTLIHTHDGAARTVSGLYEQLHDHPNVDFQFVDNSGSEPVVGTIALTQKQNYGGSRKILHDILESRRGEITPTVYKATQGSGVGGTRP